MISKLDHDRDSSSKGKIKHEDPIESKVITAVQNLNQETEATATSVARNRLFNMLTTIKLLVQADEDESQGGSSQNSHERSSTVHRHGRNYTIINVAQQKLKLAKRVLTESRAIAGGIHITSIDTASITNAVDSSEGGSTLRRRTRQGV